MSQTLSSLMGRVSTFRTGKRGRADRGKLVHTRNQHLSNHCGVPVAFSNGCSVVFSNKMSLAGGMFQRIVTCPVDLYWICPMDVQRHFPLESHFCDFRRVILCPERGGREAHAARPAAPPRLPAARRGGRHAAAQVITITMKMIITTVCCVYRNYANND